jgi:dolichyl-diphosphooligosaccharide--protein glycosyltransferase
MHEVIGFVDREGNDGIRRLAGIATSADDLLSRIGSTPRQPGDAPIFVLFTPDMMLKYPSMQRLGMLNAAAKPASASFGIAWLQCGRFVDDVLQCADETVDLRTGLITRRRSPAQPATATARLHQAMIIEGGRVVRQRDYSDSAELTVEIVMDSGAVKGVYVLDAPAFESNLNQMYFLGRFDPALFEEAFNDFPYARVFRVLVAPN